VTILGKNGGKKNPPGSGGLIDRVTGLRVLMIIVEITWLVETRFTNVKPASIKKDLARFASKVIVAPAKPYKASALELIYSQVTS
jgi:hypothetical protein